MKLIRIKAKQNMVNYKRPMSYISCETYPLPPYSTIIGMIHTACGFTSYHPMKISVQGDTRGIVSDLQTKYAGGVSSFEAGRHTLYATCDENKIGYIMGPGNTELLVDVDLIIHIKPDDENELEKIADSILNPCKFLALGRHEDIINILDVKIVEAENREEAYTKHAMYFKKYGDNDKRINGSVYKMKKTYTIDPKTNLRQFNETLKVNYISENTPIYDPIVDDEGNVICLL